MIKAVRTSWKDKFYQDLDLESLQSRRRYQKLF